MRPTYVERRSCRSRLLAPPAATPACLLWSEVLGVTAAGTGTYGFDHDDTFTTDGGGNGLGYLHNAWADVHPTWSGQAVITVAANGQTGTVTVQINCPDPKGE
ncbi:hypothetical protein [Catellatospora methionotrophica]|uniref:hypothetical protein n=1 Tax=Catellatospora methionotrophica TaxID=121620 RepID=UPI0033DDC0C9